MSVTYEVPIRELDRVLDKVFSEIPKKAVKRFLEKIKVVQEGRLKQEVRTLFKGTGGLENSITSIVESDRVITGPTKKVSSRRGVYDLGLILEKGSKGGQVITPYPPRRYLRFYWKGSIHFRKKVIRGSIRPYYFVRRTYEVMEREAPLRAYLSFKEEYERNRP